MEDAIGGLPPHAEGLCVLEGPAELLVNGPEGMARARVRAKLQRQGQHDRLGDGIETLEVIDAHTRDGPPPEATQFQEDLCHRRPVRGAAGGAEPKGRWVGPGLLPRNGVHHAHPRPQPVDHRQVRERAGVQGIFGDEGGVALGQAGRPLAQPLHLAQQVRHPAQQPVRKGAEVSPNAEGFMRESPLRRRGPSRREAIMLTPWLPYWWREAAGSGSGCDAYLWGATRPAGGHPSPPGWPWRCHPAWRGR